MIMNKISLLIFAAILLVSCSQEEPQANDAKQAPQATAEAEALEVTRSQFDAAGMQTGMLRKFTFSKTIETTGSLIAAPGQKVSVHAWFGGYVQPFSLIPGQRLRKGQRLFSMENPEFLQTQQDYLETASQLKYMYDDFVRQKKLAADSVASRKNYLRAEAEYQSLRVRHEALKKRLKLMHINPDSLSPERMQSSIPVYAPVNGIVEKVHIGQGMYLAASEPALELTGTGELLAELVLYEKDLSMLQEGQLLEFRVQQNPEKKYRSRLSVIHRSIDPDSRTASGYARILPGQQSQSLGPGMYLEASIQTDSINVPALPEEAVVSQDEAYWVLVQKEEKDGVYIFEKRKLLAGIRNDGMVEVLNAQDFEEGTQFLVKGAFGMISE
jgi:cobalt-zinc-cadmium efflux system membrane fusion protein